MAPTPPELEINFEALHHIPKRAVIDALRINPTQRYVPLPTCYLACPEELGGRAADGTIADRRVTLIVAACYVVTIGICKLPVLTCHHGADEFSSASYITRDQELMGSGEY
jgi:hypothetical protein